MFQVYRFDFANGGFYIGSTKNFRKRLYSHQYCSKNNIKQNPKLYYTWNKYPNPQVTILGTYANEKLMFECEQIWIDLFWNDAKFLNLNSIASKPPGMYGKKHSSNTRAKQSAAHKGKPKSAEQCRKQSLAQANPIIAISPTGEITYHITPNQAGIELGLDPSSIRKVLRSGIPGQRRSMKGWSFRLADQSPNQ